MILGRNLYRLAMRLATDVNYTEANQTCPGWDAVLERLGLARRLPFGFVYVPTRTWNAVATVICRSNHYDVRLAGLISPRPRPMIFVAEVAVLAILLLIIPETYLRSLPLIASAVAVVMLTTAFVLRPKAWRGRRTPTNGGDGDKH